jgi:hypothetical protein
MKYSELTLHMTRKQAFSITVNGTEFSITKRLDRVAVAWNVTSDGTLVNVYKISRRNGVATIIDNGHRFTMTSDESVTNLSCDITRQIFFEKQNVIMNSFIN